MGLFEKKEKFDVNKVKSNLKMAITRIGLLRNKKSNSIKLQKRQVAELLQQEKDESARIKVENIIREDYAIEALEILELFCDLVHTRIQLLAESKSCPHDMKEAVSTLIYAAPRTEVKELMEVRNQFSAKWGKDFVDSAMENKDLAVNQRVMFKLDVKVPEPYLCIDYLREIAKENGIEWDDSNVVTDVDVHNQQIPPANINPALQTFSIPTSEPIQHNQPFQTQQFHQGPPPAYSPGLYNANSQPQFAPNTDLRPTNQSGYSVDFNPQQPSMFAEVPPLAHGTFGNNSGGFGQDPNSYDFDELQKRFEALKKRE
ncbi:hypothetical protein C9374_004901 [Naegleria lovaniensis]|uniref:IST1-like protein n=1 Tax=Naegleria lovaniensis TaxID=51637 RepID=A0AA88GL46_NAELO|nr:uncharacterized protein C9374_004901 [Naegleria lovaniensis]KAG2382934.1 hypothetical protein C9374_004901 [Naegleria lovaniensis]